MKLSVSITTLVSVASFLGGANALGVPGLQQVFDLGQGAINQAIKFGQDSLSNYGSGPLLQTIASYLNLDLNTLTPEMHSVWDELITKFPLTISKLQLKLSVPKGRKFRKANFDFHVTDTKFPDHQLRVKSTPADLGVDTVKQYSGYLDVEDEDKHFFYWFFESRNDPKNDPVILWLNGGPGCSSMTGLFFELGPSSVGEKLKPISNPYSWNNNASVIFLDQPVNVGYSYSSSSVSNTVAAGKDVYAFLELFFKQFPEYNKKQDFHIAGESYAGHYIPQFASEILSHDDRSFKLSSVLIGNGLTDPLVQYEYYQPMACGKGGYPSVLDPEECDAMESLLPRCLSLIESCYESGSIWSCVPATIYCNNGQLLPYQRTGRNVYDIRGMCEDSNLCYKDLKYIDQYLNQDFVKDRLGAEVDSFESCNFDVNRNFMLAGDWMKPYQKNVVDLLESGLPVLIYAGDKDFICNWLGNQGWTDRLQWSGSDGFAVTPVKDWKIGKEAVGEVKNYKNLTFLRIFGGGHMVPFDQPENSLDMVNRWIAGDREF